MLSTASTSAATFRGGFVDAGLALSLAAAHQAANQDVETLYDAPKWPSPVMIERRYRHSIDTEGLFSHRCPAGDVVIWDDHCTMHRVDHSQSGFSAACRTLTSLADVIPLLN